MEIYDRDDESSNDSAATDETFPIRQAIGLTDDAKGEVCNENNDTDEASSVRQNIHAADDAESNLRNESDVTETDVQPQGGADGGWWGWVVCATSMYAYGTIQATISTFSIVYVSMLTQFTPHDPDVSFKTAWVGSVLEGLTLLMCAVAGVASDRFGLRKVAFTGGFLAFVGMLSSAFVQDLMLLYLTYGVCIGVGFAFPFEMSIVVLGSYFKKRLGLVNGIVTSGSAVLTCVYSLILPPLLKSTGLSYTLLCLSGFIFLLMPCTLTWKARVHSVISVTSGTTLSTKRETYESDVPCGGKCKFFNTAIWRNRGYVAWTVGVAVHSFAYCVPFFHIVRHSSDLFPDSDSNLLPLCISVSMGVSRLVFGLLADVRCLNPVHMQQAALLTLGITTICIPTAHSFPGLVVIALVLGLCDGVFFFLNGPIAFRLVGPRDVSQALGFYLAAMAVPVCVGPPVAGLLYDHLGSYTVAFHVSGVFSIVGALIMMLIPCQIQEPLANGVTRRENQPETRQI